MAPKTYSFHLHQVDSWFFRNGRPLYSGETPISFVQSLFPPPATTIVGCIRASLARANGWPGSGSWTRNAPHLTSILGDGEDLGQISFTGPFLAKDGLPVYHMPLNILGTEQDGNWNPKTLLLPGKGVDCDLGDHVNLPSIPSSAHETGGLKNGADYFLTAKGMESVLQEKLPAPEHVISQQNLWHMDYRISNTRDKDTRTPGENGLRGTVHVCLCSGVTMCMSVSGVPDTWTIPKGLTPLGGQGRMADLTQEKMPIVGHASLSGRRIMAVLLTPADVEGACLYPGDHLPGYPQWKIISMCTTKSICRGGWSEVASCSSQAGSLIPAGSVFHLEKTDDRTYIPPVKMHIGKRTNYGFGHMALGRWNEQGE